MRMKKKALRKEFYMEVRRTWNRFLSLLLITALGVAFFSGIRAAQPDMELSADRYYQETQLMDVSVQDMRMALWFFEYALGQAEDILIEHIFYAFLLEVEF